MPQTRIQTVSDIFENDEDIERTEQMRGLNNLLGQQAVDYSQFKMDAPEAPEQDNEMMQRYQRLAKVGAIGQMVDAVGNAIGISANQNWQPATSPVGQMGVEALDRIRNLDTDYRRRLDRHRDEVFRTDRYNQQLDIRGEEHRIQNEQRKIENDLRNLKTQYEQGQLNKRDYARAITGMQRDYIRQGYNWDPNTGQLTPLQQPQDTGEQSGMSGEGEELSPLDQLMQRTGTNLQEIDLFDYANTLLGQIDRDGMYTDGRALPGTPAAEYEEIKKTLGTKYYLLRSYMSQLEAGGSEQQQQRPDVSQSGTNLSRSVHGQGDDSLAQRNEYAKMETDPVTQRNRQAANQTTMQALVQNVINAPDEETRRQAGANFIEVAEKYVRENIDQFSQFGVTGDNVDEAVQALYQKMIQEQTDSTQENVKDTRDDPSFKGIPGVHNVYDDLSDTSSEEQTKAYSSDPAPEERSETEHSVVSPRNPEPSESNVAGLRLSDRFFQDAAMEAIERTLIENPDDLTRRELLDRWRTLLIDLYMAVGISDDEEDEAFQGIINQAVKRFEKKTEEEARKKAIGVDENAGLLKSLFGVLNRGAKVLTQPLYPGKSWESTKDLLNAPLYKEKSWKELREQRKNDFESYLDETVPARVAEGRRESKDVEMLERAQQAITGSLKEATDSQTREILKRRWLENNNQLLEIHHPELSAEDRNRLSVDAYREMMKGRSPDETIPREDNPRLEVQPFKNSGNVRGEIQEIKNNG